MTQKKYTKILESLRVDLGHVKDTQALRSVEEKEYKDIDNRIILIDKDQTIFSEDGKSKMELYKGDMFFLPEFFPVAITYGKKEERKTINNEGLSHQKESLKWLNYLDDPSYKDCFSYVAFKVKVYDVIDFFKFIDIPAFRIDSNREIYAIFQNIIEEIRKKRLGERENLRHIIKTLVIELMRYIIENDLFIEQLSMKAAVLHDLRLTAIFKYIASNIPNDLSNKVIAEEVGLSKDYIGQFFKNVTSMNLQQYIEMIRLNKAVELLKTTNLKIKDISKATGFHDLAYFCRKFKVLWGVTAKKMRARINRSLCSEDSGR